ncbi:MAG TPA: amidase [Candidatus Polarisedimenticolia bacterium]|nr:amidase [Candidatus Polarisedimenticolia bacterium]
MLDRRRFLAAFSGIGLGSTLLPGTLWALAQGKPGITREMIEQAESIAGVTLPGDVRAMMLENLNDQAKGYEAIYGLHLPNSVEPCLLFDPLLPGMSQKAEKGPGRMSAAPAIAARGVPKDLEEVAFWNVRALAELVRAKKVSATALTDMYLARLKRFDPLLKFNVTLTEDRARAQAQECDRDQAAGRYRGPLHGLPWGAKDLLAVKGYPTTWGAGGFEKQTIDEDATVVKRLDAAGAVLVSKLTLGALAMGDVWYGGTTRNPWNPSQGSSGSSAGPASATAAGCVAFSIGSETLGSIASPSTRCGTTGLRPTFGRVPRTGAMALSWSMDKLGPIGRAVEDCALVLESIAGPDGHDRTVRGGGFAWDAELDWRRLRVGYLKADFEPAQKKPDQDAPAPGDGVTVPPPTPQQAAKAERDRARREARRVRGEYDRRYDQAALQTLRGLGVDPVTVTLPELPYEPMVSMLLAEAAAAFDELTRTGRDKLLTAQGPDDWPNAFRSARFIPAVEYIQASRARRLAQEQVAKAFENVDVIVAPSFSSQLVVTNLTGHPALILPNGFRGEDAPKPPADAEIQDNVGGPGTPVSLTFIGRLYGEAKLLALARAYQEKTGFHLKQPPLPPRA